MICGIANKTKNKITEKDSATSDNKLKKDKIIEELILSNHRLFISQKILSLKCIVI